VNDGSNDATPEILDAIDGKHVIHHKNNTHIPGCIRDGMRYAVEQGYRYAITMDAGFSHDPYEIPRFLKHQKADLVLGCRVLHRGTPFHRRMLSKIGNLAYNVCLDFPRTLFSNRYRDVTSGFRMYSNRAMRLILSHGCESRSYDVMLETAHLIRTNRLYIAEADISYRYSNSSLNFGVVCDCLLLCVKILSRSMCSMVGRLCMSILRLPKERAHTLLK
jgi:glycosyltransferase involved in cell wall biosynthesis